MGKTAVARQRRVREAEKLGSGVLVAFFVSGMAGLLHEIAWTRLLRLVMGNTTYALTTVLCVFMAGLALGSFIAGRRIEKRDDPLRVFAFLELTIGLYCLLLPFLINATQPIYRAFYQSTHSTLLVLSLIRFLVCGVLILLPATLMGATLPVLTRFFFRIQGLVGLSVGKLYAINTFGAVGGAAITGFFLIPTLGVRKTILVASLLNLLVAAIAFWLHRRSIAYRSPATPPPAARRHEPRREAQKRRWEVAAGSSAEPVTGFVASDVSYGSGVLVALVVGYGFSGAAALIYEIAWMRVLSLMFGSSVYALSLMLTAFILGLALGSAVVARFVDRLDDPLRVLALVQIAIAAASLIVVPVFGHLPFFVTGLIARVGGSFWGLQAAQFALVFLIMLIPTTLMGAAFPLASRVFTGSSNRASRSVGTVYAGNTLGAIIGSFVGGFALIPWIGIQRTILVGVWVNALVGATYLLASRSWGTPRRLTLLAATVLVVALSSILMPQWDASRMSFGPFAKARRLRPEIASSAAALQQEAEKTRVLFHREGLVTTVTVKQHQDGGRSLYVNGKADASTFGNDLITQEMLAHVPLLLHANPQSTLVIGLASGITLGSAGLHPVTTMDCAEISPAMIEACHYFDDYNHNVLEDSRVRVLTMDGRNHLAMTDARYDVIISEPSNPWIAGVADLFTREFFELCHARLKPDGIACVWLEVYNIDEGSFRSVVRTFQSIFPEVSIWNPTGGDFLLIGAKSALDVDHVRLSERLRNPAVSTDLERIGITSVADFLSHIVMTSESAKRFSNGSPLHTDDNALLEFSTPRILVRNVGEAALRRAIEEHRQVDLSFLTASNGGAQTLNTLRTQVTRFIKAKGHVVEARLLVGDGRRQAARRELGEAAALNPDDTWVQEFVNQGVVQANTLVGQGNIKEGIAAYRDILDLRPNSATALGNLAFLLATSPDRTQRDVPEAIRLAERLAAITKESTASLSTLSVTYASAGRLIEAEALATRALNQAQLRGESTLTPQLEQRLESLKQQIAAAESAQ